VCSSFEVLDLKDLFKTPLPRSLDTALLTSSSSEAGKKKVGRPDSRNLVTSMPSLPSNARRRSGMRAAPKDIAGAVSDLVTHLTLVGAMWGSCP